MKTQLNNLFSKDETEHGTYKGYNWIIRNFGSHFCAYVEIPKDHPLYGKGWNDEAMYELSCNGGVTYTNESANGWIIGWDYAHCFNIGESLHFYQIQEDVEDVIEQLVSLKNS